MNPAQVIFLIFAIVTALVAFVLLRLGFRGRRVGDHPYCARCGFDLTGKPAGSLCCPECGADITSAEQIHIGVRHYRNGLLIVGSCCVFLALASFDEVRITSSGFSWIQYVPSRMLFSWLTSSDWKTATNAEDELIRRYDNGNLDHALVVSELAKMPVPSNAKPQFYFDLGNRLIEDGAMHGDLSPAAWATYCQSLCTYQIVTRQHVRRGAPIPINIRSMIFAGSIQTSCYALHTTALSLDIDGIPLNATKLTSDMRNMPDWAVQGSGGTGKLIVLPSGILNGLADGTHTIHVRGQLTVTVSGTKSASSIFTRTSSTTFILEPGNFIAVKLKVDPSLRTKMAQAFSNPTITVESSGEARIGLRGDSLPFLVAGELLLRADHREWNFNPPRSTSLRIGTTGSFSGDFGGALPGFKATSADIIIRPDPAWVEQSIAPDEIWGEDIVIPNVPVQRPQER